MPVGVSYREYFRGKAGNFNREFTASIAVNGNQKIKTYSCNKYGMDGAKAKAIKWRNEEMKNNKKR
ncbi:MAG: hypothetical protein HAW67_04910 [Endozoicomonadaceae bacterium]|nr:hypothetical protein [Endozoicomonadaceae bacterium]